MYACPICKTHLTNNTCRRCGYEFQSFNTIPIFFTNSELSNSYKAIGEYYDNLYGTVENVWNQLAGRGLDFVNYVASLIMQYNPLRYLDVGCGEGYLLASVKAPKKYGIDISHNALEIASKHLDANLCIGFAEQLPFPTEYFDVITSIGVMTHFIEDIAATKEIYRVLRDKGYYIVGIYIPPKLTEIILNKFLEYILPRPRPISLLYWLLNKGKRLIGTKLSAELIIKDQQPIKRFYTAEKVEHLFNVSGFVIEDVITKRNKPITPLSGLHFRIYILKK